jgi:hypothetical protein
VCRIVRKCLTKKTDLAKDAQDPEFNPSTHEGRKEGKKKKTDLN